MSFSTYIEIDGVEYLIEAVFDYFPAYKGSRNEYGVPMEPDGGAVAEISSIRLRDGDIWMSLELPDAVIKQLEEKILEEM